MVLCDQHKTFYHNPLYIYTTHTIRCHLLRLQVMSIFVETFHKVARKTPVPQFASNPKPMHSSDVVPDSRTRVARLQNQCIRPEVGMYSVLTVGDHLDVMVCYVQALPYTLPGPPSDDTQVTYVIPKQDLNVGDFFTLFIGRKHFMVKVVKVLKSSSGNDEQDSDSDSSSIVNVPTRRASRAQPVYLSAKRHSGSHSPSAGHRQDRDTYISPSPRPVLKPVIKDLPARPDQHHDDQTMISTRTRVDSEKIQNSTRTNVPEDFVYAVVDLDPTPYESCDHSSKKTHQTNPATKYDIDISHLHINVNLQTTSVSPSTNIHPSRRPESLMLPMHSNVSTQKARKRSISEHNNIPTGTVTSNGSPESQVPQSVLLQVTNAGECYTIKKTSRRAVSAV